MIKERQYGYMVKGFVYVRWFKSDSIALKDKQGFGLSLNRTIFKLMLILFINKGFGVWGLGYLCLPCCKRGEISLK